MPGGGGGGRREVELGPFSNVVAQFDGGIERGDEDRVWRLIAKEIPAKMAAALEFGNARRNSDRENARVARDWALGRTAT